MKTNIKEYVEGYDVEVYENDKKRLVVAAANEGGYCSTEVDLIDILKHAKSYLPEIWEKVVKDIQGEEDNHAN